MIDQKVYQKAAKFAGEAHRFQRVPGTRANYLLHLSNVAMEVLVAYYETQDFDVNIAVQIALLHDTIEDTFVTYGKIESIFGKDVAEGVQALSKNKKLPKEKRIKDSMERILILPKETAIVKLADRITNLQKPPAKWSGEKIKKYRLSALEILEALRGYNTYLENRLERLIQEYKSYC
jgi:(p)ppGpp synthase/HD superfamily hydrolase